MDAYSLVMTISETAFQRICVWVFVCMLCGWLHNSEKNVATANKVHMKNVYSSISNFCFFVAEKKKQIWRKNQAYKIKYVAWLRSIFHRMYRSQSRCSDQQMMGYTVWVVCVKPYGSLFNTSRGGHARPFSKSGTIFKYCDNIVTIFGFDHVVFRVSSLQLGFK